LPGANFLKKKGDPLLLRWLKWADTHLLRFTLRHSTAVLVSWLCWWLFSSRASPGWAASSCRAFNEGSLTIAAMAPPGVSMEESNRIALRVEKLLMEIPEVKHVSRRTGRAELDEHAENVNFSEIDVGLIQPERPKPGFHFAVLRAIPGAARLRRRRRRPSPRRRHGGDPRHRGRGSRRQGEHRAADFPSPGSHDVRHPLADRRQTLRPRHRGTARPGAGHRRGDGRVPGVVDLQMEPQVDIPRFA
jgi:hypothetical protein